MEESQRLFMALLRSGLYGCRLDPTLFVNVDWNVIFRLADIQTVVAIVLDGIALLPHNIQPPAALKMRYIALTQKVEQMNKIHRKTMCLIHSTMVQNNIQEIYMKGQIAASRYPFPLHRQPGDIDFIVASRDFERTLKSLSSIGRVDFEMIHEHHGMALINNVIVEPHFAVHNFQCPSVNRAMKAFFDEIFPDGISMINLDGCELPSFPPTFESVLYVGHMVNHVYAEGLGLRQIIDYAMFLRNCGNCIEPQKHAEYLAQMKMHRAWRIFSCICSQYLYVRMPSFVDSFSHKEKDMARCLFEDIMHVGNFGRGEYVFQYNGVLNRIRNYCWVVHRCFSLHFVCPSEANWWAVSKLNRFISKSFKRLSRIRKANSTSLSFDS